MKHSTLPPSPLTANCTASLEMIGGPTGRKTQSGQSDLEPTVLAGQVPLRALTIHIKGYLSLSHSDSRHYGTAGIGASICLGH